MGSAAVCGCSPGTLVPAPQLLWGQPAETWVQSLWEAEAPAHGPSKMLPAWQSSGPWRWTEKLEAQANKFPEEAWIQEHNMCTLCGLQKEEAEAWGTLHHPTFLVLWAHADLPSSRVRRAWKLLLEPCALLTHHSLLDLDVLYGKISGFLKNLIQSSFIFNMIFFLSPSTAANPAQSCSWTWWKRNIIKTMAQEPLGLQPWHKHLFFFYFVLSAMDNFIPGSWAHTEKQ